MVPIGERLRQERLRRGLDLFKIAEQTKINPAFLEAIESGDLDKLPGVFFTRSFVRQYAQALDIPDDEVDQDSDHTGEGLEPAPEPVKPQRDEFKFVPVARPLRTSRRTPDNSSLRSLGSLGAFAVIVAACTAIFVLWEHAREVRPPSPPTARVAAPAAKSTPTTASASPVMPQPAALGTPTASAETEDEASAPTPAPQPSTTLPMLSTMAEGQTAAVRLEIHANSQAWIRVIADSKHLFSGVLDANQSRSFEAAQSILLRTGNAGAVELTWNGQVLQAIGPAGQVRDAQFTANAWKIVPLSPARPAEPEPAASPEATPEAEAQ